MYPHYEWVTGEPSLWYALRLSGIGIPVTQLCVFRVQGTLGPCCRLKLDAFGYTRRAVAVKEQFS